MNRNRWEQGAKRFERDCGRAVEISRDTLRRIMKDNQNTEYGRLHHFDMVETEEDYRRLVPVTDYGNYEDYIERMRSGEGSLLTVYAPRCFITTSGSAGRQKWIPLSDEALSHMLDDFLYACHGRTPGIDSGRCLMMSVFRTLPTEPERETILSVAHHQALYEKEKPEIARCLLGGEELLFSQEIGDVPYVKLWIALSSPDMTGIQAIYLYDALLFFRYFEENWEQVLSDLQRRRIPREISIGENARRAMLALPCPPEEWFLQVRRECEAGFAGIVKRIWKDFQWISGIGGSTFTLQETVLRGYLGDVPIHYYLYAASECFIGISVEPERREYVIAPRAGYFEFLPCGGEEDAASEAVAWREALPLAIGELEAGREYEILVTNFSGLYRYRLGDVVKVTGFYGESPIVTVCRRKAQALNVAGERMDVQTAALAIEKLSERLQLRIYEYSIGDDKSLLPGRYQCFLETDGALAVQGASSARDDLTARDASPVRDEGAADCSDLLDEIFMELNDDYRDLRGLGMIGTPEIYRVKPGTHQACRERFRGRQAHSKPLRYISDPAVIAFMKERIL